MDHQQLNMLQMTMTESSANRFPADRCNAAMGNPAPADALLFFLGLERKAADVDFGWIDGNEMLITIVM